MRWIAVWVVLLWCVPGSGAQTSGGSEEQAGRVGSVAHGKLHHETFATSYVKGLPGDLEPYVVYTPPNYDAERKPAYPVLYLLHGWGGNADAWVAEGHANTMLDQMIASGKAKPMIVVMPLGYGDMTFLTNGFEVWRDQKQITSNVLLFQSALLEEIMPRVEKSYNIAADREHRAIAGLSMGGLEALTIGLRHPELFASIGGFSSAIFPIPGADLMRLDADKEDLRLLWIACGTEDDLLSINRIFEMHMRREGLPVTAIETPGRHEWPVWRDNFQHFVPLLFGDPTATPVEAGAERSSGVN